MSSDKITEKLIELRKKQLALTRHWDQIGDKDLLQFIVDILPASLQAERCGVFLVNPESNKLWMVSGTHLEERALFASVDGSIVGRVIKSGEPVEVKDLEDKVGEHNIAGVKTGFLSSNILCVPVFNQGRKKVIGAIQLLNKHRAAFTEKDYTTLNTLAVLVRENLEEIYERQKLVTVLSEVESRIRHLEKLMVEARRKES